MKFLVIGCGSIGRRHIRNLLSLGQQAVGVDLSDEYRKWVEENLKVKAYEDMQEAIAKEKPQGCFVCTPPHTHVALAKRAIEAGMHIFIEKPVSHNLEGVKELGETAKRKGVVLCIGYNLRFNGGVQKIRELIEKGGIGRVMYARAIFGEYLPDWRPWQDYKKSYSAKREQGGGIILDASHEIDYVSWLLGTPKKVSCFAGKVSDLELDVEDNAEISVEYEGGAVASIHLDFVRRDRKRWCEVIGTKGTIEYVFNSGEVSVFDGEGKKWRKIAVEDKADIAFVKETEDFLRAIGKKAQPLVTLEEGVKTLSLALAAKEAAEERKVILLDNKNTNKGKTVVIVQARMGSTRLPGKSLMEIEGKPLIWHVIERARKAKLVDEVVLATTVEKSDDALAKFARENGIKCFRGSLEDVLDRYYQAAKAAGAGTLVRVTGDCPLIDPLIIDKALAEFSKGKYDYVSNTEKPWMDGFDVEVFSFAALEKSWKEAKLQSEREHVTLYIRNGKQFKKFALKNDARFEKLQCSVDRENDLKFVKEIYREMIAKGLDHSFSHLDVIALLEEKPQLLEINKGAQINAWLEGAKKEKEGKRKK